MTIYFQEKVTSNEKWVKLDLQDPVCLYNVLSTTLSERLDLIFLDSCFRNEQTM
jgi:hypothetical protein